MSLEARVCSTITVAVRDWAFIVASPEPLQDMRGVSTMSAPSATHDHQLLVAPLVHQDAHWHQHHEGSVSLPVVETSMDIKQIEHFGNDFEQFGQRVVCSHRYVSEVLTLRERGGYENAPCWGDTAHFAVFAWRD